MMTRSPAPYKSEAVDISADDHTFALTTIDGIYVGGTGGVVRAQLVGDSGPQDWPVGPWQYLAGRFTKVFKVGTTAGSLVGYCTAVTPTP